MIYVLKWQGFEYLISKNNDVYFGIYLFGLFLVSVHRLFPIIQIRIVLIVIKVIII